MKMLRFERSGLVNDRSLSYCVSKLCADFFMATICESDPSMPRSSYGTCAGTAATRKPVKSNNKLIMQDGACTVKTKKTMCVRAPRCAAGLCSGPQQAYSSKSSHLRRDPVHQPPQHLHDTNMHAGLCSMHACAMSATNMYIKDSLAYATDIYPPPPRWGCGPGPPGRWIWVPFRPHWGPETYPYPPPRGSPRT
jgi:hypothetical protein